jgi:hypothetical protein
MGLDAARTSADAEIAPIREPQSVNVMALRDATFRRLQVESALPDLAQGALKKTVYRHNLHALFSWRPGPF